jgi:hypothetical protein
MTGIETTECTRTMRLCSSDPRLYPLSGPPERHFLLTYPRGRLVGRLRSAARPRDRLQSGPGLLPQNYQNVEVFRCDVPTTVHYS